MWREESRDGVSRKVCEKRFFHNGEGEYDTLWKIVNPIN